MLFASVPWAILKLPGRLLPNRTYIGNIVGVLNGRTGHPAVPVIIDQDGQLGTVRLLALGSKKTLSQWIKPAKPS